MWKLAVLEDRENIDKWLRIVAGSIVVPLRRRKFKKKCCDVTLGIELYKMRYLDTFYVEFVIYSEAVARHVKEGSPDTPIFTRRMVNVGVARPDGSNPDFPMPQNSSNQLEFLREQIVQQGNAIFQHIHSLETLLRAYRGEVPEVPIERGSEAAARYVAELIEKELQLEL